MKLKTLLPSLKEKKRYVAFEVLSDKAVSQNSAKESISNALLKLFGEMGMAKAGLMFLPDWEHSKGIARVNSSCVNDLKAAMALISSIDGDKAIVRSTGVSGILNKARKKSVGG